MLFGYEISKSYFGLQGLSGNTISNKYNIIFAFFVHCLYNKNRIGLQLLCGGGEILFFFFGGGGLLLLLFLLGVCVCVCGFWFVCFFFLSFLLIQFSCTKFLVLSLQMFKSLKCGFLKGTETFVEITYF